MTAVEPATERQPQSAAAPSPFPPIAEYAFLSNCHTGALVAPDGAIDWLCVPSFDSPSVFGSLLDREAGFFRFAPFGINHPTAVVYQPGTNVLETTWKTPNGWIMVRDALTMSPRNHEDTITPHTRPRSDPGPPFSGPGPALGAHDQGTHLHADGGDGGCAHHIAAGDTGRRAQLGLPLHMDSGHDLHAASPPHAQPGLGGRRVHAIRRRCRGHRGRLAADHVRDRRPPRPDGVHARPDDGLRRRQSG